MWSRARRRRQQCWLNWLPRIANNVDTFSISPNPIIDPLAWYDERIDATSGWKFVRKHCWLTNLRRHG